MSGDDPNALGRIALKQVRVSRAEVEARNRESVAATNARSSSSSSKAGNPRNRLVPYLDLFGRLSDEELARLAHVPASAAEGLRKQIEEVNRALGRFTDLLPRLNDDELVRLTGANIKTVRFWRLSQPRHLQGDPRRTNPDVTPAPQPLPRRESSGHHSVSSSESSDSFRRSESSASSASSAESSDEFVIDVE